jgi:branched-subunit amino acid aminotransferase/4-amino-4-deoxychorismate lyase
MDNVYDYVSVNLEVKEKNELSFPFLDHGFLYGYGLFESIQVKDGWPVLLRKHLSRLRRGSIILDIPFISEQDAIVDAVLALIKQNKMKSGMLNLYLTAGDRSQDTSRLKEDPEPLLLMIPRKFSGFSDNAAITLSVKQESFQRTPLDRVKSMSWMKNVLERKMYPEGDDVLLYDVQNEVLESCTANVFFVKGRRLITPESHVILSGITRQFLLNHQDEFSFEVSYEKVNLDDLDSYDEIFLTNSLRGIIKVKQTFDYENLKSGKITDEVSNRYESLIQEHVNQSLSFKPIHSC